MYTIAMKKVIGLDFDDVLMDFHAALYDYHNPLYKTDLSRDQMTTYHIEEIIGVPREVLEQRIVDFYHSDTHHHAPAVAGAIEAVKKLSEDHSLVIITSRPEFIKEHTLNWLERNFGAHFDHVYFTNLFKGSGTKKSKAEACKELGVDIFIDDHHVYAQDVAQSGKSVLLFNAPWNQSNELHPNITRVSSWDHILSHLRDAKSYKK